METNLPTRSICPSADNKDIHTKTLSWGDAWSGNQEMSASVKSDIVFAEENFIFLTDDWEVHKNLLIRQFLRPSFPKDNGRWRHLWMINLRVLWTEIPTRGVRNAFAQSSSTTTERFPALPLVMHHY